MTRPDVLVVSLGTTLGWRVADRLFIDQLERAGASAVAAAVAFGAAGRLRRGYPLNDIVEMHAARRATRTAVARHSPRAIVFSSTTAAMLAPALEVPYAVRLDAPAAMNRPGARNAVLHALERRGLGRARLTLPLSGAAHEVLPPGSAPAVVVPPPVEPSGPLSEEREPLAVAYVPDPKAKGPAGPQRTCPMRGWRSTGSTPNGRGRICAARGCPSRKGSNSGGRCPPLTFAPGSAEPGSTREEPAGRTSARRRSRRSPTARCSRPSRRAGRSRRCDWRGSWESRP